MQIMCEKKLYSTSGILVNYANSGKNDLINRISESGVRSQTHHVQGLLLGSTRELHFRAIRMYVNWARPWRALAVRWLWAKSRGAYLGGGQSNSILQQITGTVWKRELLVN